jgi:hypothetical protein
MHSRQSAEKRIAELLKGKDEIYEVIANASRKSQTERLTVQPKRICLNKSNNHYTKFFGGYYYFTSDEVEVKENNVFLIEENIVEQLFAIIRR